MNKNTYSQAGVDINKGNELVNNIKSLVNRTNRAGLMSDIGGFSGLFPLDSRKYKNPVLVSGTDGVGTKLMIAQAVNKHETIGIDLVAMCANDVLCQGAVPLFFLDYFATGKLEISTARKVISGITNGCEEAGMVLIGGETAEMPGMYENNKYDLAGFCVGIVEHSKILPKQNIKPSDVLIGIKSSGLHSNGFSLVRKILKQLNIKLTDTSPWKRKSWEEILLSPTSIYVKSVLPILEHVKGIAHITGGGMIENIPRILPKELNFSLSYKNWPEIFLWLQQEGNIEKEEMLKVFNCGVGMVLVSEKNKSSEIIARLNKDEKVYAEEIGYVTLK